MFKALFVFIGFGLVALGVWFGSVLLAILGIAFLAFVIWWIRSTRTI